MNRLAILFGILLLGCQGNRTADAPKQWQGAGKLLVSETEIVLDSANFRQATQKRIQLYNPTQEEVTVRTFESGPELSTFRVVRGKEVSANEAFTLRGGALETLVVKYSGDAPEPFDDYEGSVHYVVNGDTLLRGFYVGREQW